MDRSGISKDELASMGFSSQMYNIFPVGEDGRPLYNMMLWSDSRSEEQSKRIEMIYGKRYLYDETGCPMNSLFPVTKIMWLRENEAKIYEEADKFISIKAYVLKDITGEYLIDYSMASATGLFNVTEQKWSYKALGIVGLTEDRLSRPISGLEQLSFVNTELLADLGLPEDIIVISGGGDGPLANIGSGACQEGVINVDLGTSGAARVITGEPTLDQDERLWNFAVTENKWVYGGILSNVGNGYAWLIRNVAEFAYAKSIDDIYEVVDSKLKKLPPAIDDLLFIPYLLKARSPYWDDRTKATIYGLTHEHTLVDIVKSYLESIGYNLFSVVTMINEKVKLVPYIILTGGLSNSTYLCQMLADILGKEIVVLKTSEGSIMGAALMALYSVGLIEDLMIDNLNQKEKVYKPDMNKHIEYQKKYVKYTKLRTAIRGLEL